MYIRRVFSTCHTIHTAYRTPSHQTQTKHIPRSRPPTPHPQTPHTTHGHHAHTTLTHSSTQHNMIGNVVESQTRSCHREPALHIATVVADDEPCHFCFGHVCKKEQTRNENCRHLLDWIRTVSERGLRHRTQVSTKQPISGNFT